MNCFIFLGPPGAGKGTQSALLQERLHYTHISTGALIRAEISSKSALGLKVKDLVESGRLVDDEMIVDCLMSHLDKLNSKCKEVILLDGIPRNLNQAKLLEKLMPNCFKGVIALNAHPDKLIARFSKRWHCADCGRVESFAKPPADHIKCDICGGLFIRRKDDEPEVILSRFKIYEEQTAALLEYYRNKEMLYEFDALQSMEVTYIQLASLILQKIRIKY